MNRQTLHGNDMPLNTRENLRSEDQLSLADHTRLMDQMGFEGPVDDVQYPAHYRGAVREQKTELKRKVQQALSHRQPG